MARIEVQNVSKVFVGRHGDVFAVKDVTFTVGDGEFVVIVGPSGCGKTTFLRLIAGLDPVTQGTISIEGRVVNNSPPKERDVAMVFQNFALYPHMTAYDNMAFGLKMRNVPKREIEERVEGAAKLLELTPLLQRLPKTLSGGQCQRVALGRAIVRQPKVFLLDEPLSNLDVKMRVQMRAELSKLHDRLRATIIFVTHDQTEAMTMGDRIVVMKDGAIQQIAQPVDLYEKPANLFVAGFIGYPSMNLFEGTIYYEPGSTWFKSDATSENSSSNGLRLRLSDEHAIKLQKYDSKRAVLGLRPENISATFHKSVENSTDATIDLIEPMGSENYLHLSSYRGTPFVARVPSSFRTKSGQTLTVQFDMASAYFFDAKTGVALP